jgi:lysyl-tRNA synthetase, class II
MVTTLRDAGIDPYPRRFDVSHSTHEVCSAFEAIQRGHRSEASVRIAGRVMAVRQLGGQTFADLVDHAGHIQLSVKSDVVGPDSYRTFSEVITRGDIVGVEGIPFRTRRGELSI